MTAARARRPLVLLIVAAVTVGLGLAVPPAPAAAAELPVRLEAAPTGRHVRRRVADDVRDHGDARQARRRHRPRPPHRAARRHVAADRRGRAGRPLVRESAVAHVAGFAGATTFAPARPLSLPAGTWELYRFAADGTLETASPWTTTGTTAIDIDRSSIVRGLRHVRVATGAWAGWWIPGSPTAPEPVRCTAGGPPDPASPLVIRSLATAPKEIALTFDMGGRLVPAMSIVRYLELRRCAPRSSRPARWPSPTRARP